MAIPFITRRPTEQDITRLRLLMSVFRDGSGQERDKGGTRAGWRDLERTISELIGGYTLEKKEVFDIIVKSTKYPNRVYGVSVKTKCLGSSSSIINLDKQGRVYMELTNSPAKLWAPLKAKRIGEKFYGNNKYAQLIGESILETVHNWYLQCKTPNLDLEKSVHLVISYSDDRAGDRIYQIHSFPIGFKPGIKWQFSSSKCLRGYDPDYPGEVLFDWYGLSGGQLKYYPRARSAKYSSRIFTLLAPNILSLTEKSKLYWPKEWEGF